MDEETGLMMLKGKKERVEEVQNFIERLKGVGGGGSKTAVKPSTSVAIRIVWLTNGPKPTEAFSEVDPKLQQIIDRLVKQGIKGLAVGMQLISRCDPTPSKGQCSLTGSADLTNDQLELMVDAQFGQTPGSTSCAGNVKIRATRTPNSTRVVSESRVQVDINAEAGKYYVLSSAPIGNQHAVFVVQLLDDF